MAEKDRGGKPKSTNMYVVRGKKSLSERKDGANNNERSKRRDEKGDDIDQKFGFDRLTEGAPRTGWLLNYIATTIIGESGREKAGLELYFVDREGQNFKASVLYDPYFFIDVAQAHTHRLSEISKHLELRFEGCRATVENKEDLDLPNHLAGVQHKFIKITFDTVGALIEAKTELKSIVDYRNSHEQSVGAQDDPTTTSSATANMSDPLGCVVGIREYDVPYSMRVAIDLDIRVGAWYVVTPEATPELGSKRTCTVDWRKEILDLCEPRILAFDIECEKSPLKFPNADRDRIFMISYMTKGQGYLIINREIVSKDVLDFEYTPKPNFPGPFKVINVDNEEKMLRYFISHIQELKPHIIVTYNGDRFDWPYVESRCGKYSQLSLYENLGIRSIKGPGGGDTVGEVEYLGRCMVHLDAFSWVQRDSYLPQGNQGLKSVTRCKLGYDPVEVDPEDMLNYAREKPDHMASYSVSDAVATYYLYTTYVHNFIFSLSTIIPMASEDVLRKGSGTLCEALLMVEAFRGNIICPNKQNDPLEGFYNGKLVESETYIGGHVECLEAGIFRADIPSVFSLVPAALQQLIDHVDRDIAFAMEIEHGIPRSDAANYDEVKQAIVEKLEMLRDCPNREEHPVIYHLDVGAMYPNIILTNRLQPSSIVSTADCASCKYNQSSSNCKRPMTWTWRGEYSPAGLSEYNAVKRQLSQERVVGTSGEEAKAFFDLSAKEQAALAKARLKLYAQRVYKRSKVSEIQERVSTVCMRENSFYVDTVKAFRDRRYEYKLSTKTWKNQKNDAEKRGDRIARKIAEDREILMDSLQLAHKCILNSFYGYVMRKGARWRSMEMAGIVTHTGAQLIRQARELVEQVGRPLELDTDGIWCILPASFPKELKIQLRSGKSISLNYPCAMLNADVHERYTNHQYQVLDQSTGKPRFATHAECSIFFELDGPYKAMVLPASPEEGRLLKKKYVVFNFDGTVAELKGFEVKRRGELELVKIFQSEVFESKVFLEGNCLEDCYAAVGAVANQWLDVLDEQGRRMDDDQLLELISERKTISKTVEDYDGRKSTSLTTAGRLADFLGAEMVQDKGLNCNLIISRLPAGAPVTDRAIPVAIFSCEPNIRRFFLRKWLKDSTLDCDDFRNVVDWSYYKERLGKSIQKIISIPAGMQLVRNPCPRIEHPPWLQKKLTARGQGKKQLGMRDMFSPKLPTATGPGLFAAGTDQHIKTARHILAHDSSPLKAGKRDAEHVVDIEEMTDVIVAHSSLVPATASVEESETVTTTVPVLDHAPSSAAELHSWLSARKNQWKQARAMRKAQNVSIASGNPSQWASSVKNKKPAGVMDFVRSANLAATFGTWQVLEIQEMVTPGDFLVWAFTSPTDLQRLVLHIPRAIFVNILKSGKDAQLAAADLKGVKSRRELPHGKECLELFEIEMSEKRFQLNDRSVNLFLANSEVEGVYESLVPLWFRAVIKMGCVCKVSNNRKRSGQAQLTYDLSDLDMVHTNAHPYLSPSSAQYKRIFIYFAQDRSRTTNPSAVLAIFFLQSSNKDILDASVAQAEGADSVEDAADNLLASRSLSARCHVWLVTGRTVTSLESKPPLQRIFQRFQPSSKAEIKFSTLFVATTADAWRLGNARLEQYSRQHQGPTIVVAQGGNHSKIASLNTSTSMAHREWRHSLPALHEFPLTVMPAHTLDEHFPAVGWSTFAAERLIQRYILHMRWYLDRLHCASYSQIPLCNLSNDALTVIIDVLYARLLQQNRHLLWASGNSASPDLGLGAAPSQDLWQIWAEPLQEPQVNNPGLYRCACVELDVYGLAVSAIMVSADLDSDGLIQSTVPAAGGMFDKESAASMACSEASVGRAFAVFKALVTKCMEDLKRDRLADSLLTAIYRYLCGYGNGLLTDPLLHRVVYTLMCRLFWKLIRAFCELGVEIVYADFSRIIIATKRQTQLEAQEYVDFILNAVTSKELFGYLQVSVKQRWEQLVWLETENFAALPFPVPEAAEEAEEEEMHAAGESGAPTEEDEGKKDDENEKEEDSASFDLKAIKRSVEKYSFNRPSQSRNRARERTADDDEDEYEEDSSDGEVDDISDDGEHPAPQRKYDSIGDLLDTFEEVDHRTEEPDEVQGGEVDEELPERVVQRWSMCASWPPIATIFFEFHVAEFILRYEKAVQKNVGEQLGESAAMKHFLSAEQSPVVDEEDVVAQATVDLMQYIEGELTKALLTDVDQIVQMHGGRTVALEFVKAICHVMTLEGSCATAVQGMRRLLLVQLQVQEFSTDSDFQLSAESYVLRDVICSYCSVCRDFDLLRDRALLAAAAAKEAWKCPYCLATLNMEEIESRLLQNCEQFATRFLLQDFRCAKTHMVSRRLCTAQSDLCAPLAMDYSAISANKDAAILTKVAQTHRFAFLLQAIKDITLDE